MQERKRKLWRADNDCMIKNFIIMETVQFQEHILIVELLKERQQKWHDLGMSSESRSETTLTTYIRIWLEKNLWLLQAFRNHNWDQKLTMESLKEIQCKIKKKKKKVYIAFPILFLNICFLFSGFPFFSASNLIKQADCKWKIRWWYSFRKELEVVRPGKSESQKEPQKSRMLSSYFPEWEIV